MSDGFRVDLSNLMKIVEEMKPKARVRLLESVMRKQANTISKRAFDILKSRVKKISNKRALKKTIWTKVYHRVPGFLVSVYPNKKAMYPSRMKIRGRVREIPLSTFLEKGSSEPRKTRGKEYNRGELEALHFLRDAADELEPTVITRVETELINRLKKRAQKYGAK